MKRILMASALGAVAIFFIAGCNAFEFAKPASAPGDYVAEGQDHMWNKEYAEAEVSFTKALEKDPANAVARWGRAKARLRQTGFASITLVTELSRVNMSGGTQGGSLPFQNLSDWPWERIGPIYATIPGVLSDLSYIYTGQTRGTEITKRDIALDYAAGLSVMGVLTFRDTNMDGVINADDLSLAPYFQGGELQLPPNAVAIWNDMKDSGDAAQMVNQVVNNLGQGVLALADQLITTEGINADSLRIIINQVQNDLLNNSTWSH